MFESLALWLENFHFQRPWWLLALVPAVALAAALWRRRLSAGQWQAFIAPHLLQYLLEGEQGHRSRWPLLGLMALWMLAVVALAGPAWQKLPQPVQKSGSALVVLWDMSPSMIAQDMKPSRLVRSRMNLIDLLRAREEGVTGLVAYAGEGHIVTPLTDDTETIISLLPALSPDTMPLAGSNPEMALRMAYRLLEDAGIAQGNVLFITDGIVPEAFATLSRLADGSAHQITIWGVGTTEGAPVPLAQGGFARDGSGNIVVARLNEDELQNFAADAGAYYVPMLKSGEDIETLQTLFNAPGEDNLRQTDRVFDTWYEHGPWLLLLILPFVAMMFRRGWLMCLPLVLLPLSLPQPAEASVWEDLWQTRSQQAQEALQQEQPDKAAQLFEDPAWRGTALYRAEDYQAALDAFRRGGATSDNLYNQGNALMQLGDYQKAIEAYNAALEKNPENADAAANRTLAEKLLEQQQQNQQQNGQQNNQPQGDQQQNNQQQGSQGSRQNQQGQNQQGQKQDGQNGQSQGQQQNQPYDDPSNNQAGAGDQSRQQSEEQKQAGQQQEPGAEESERRQQTQQAKAGGEQGEPQDAMASTQMSETEREQQQALEQWLRKVPDDPSGLIRNKFMYEYRERRLNDRWRAPENNADQRW